MSAASYLGMKGQHIYDPESSYLSMGIIRMPNPSPEIVHFNLKNVTIPKEVNLKEALKTAEVVSCDYKCSKDYTIHLFKKKGGLMGWLERKLVSLDSIRDFGTFNKEADGHYITYRAVEDIPGYEKIATISSPGSKL